MKENDEEGEEKHAGSTVPAMYQCHVILHDRVAHSSKAAECKHMSPNKVLRLFRARGSLQSSNL